MPSPQDPSSRVPVGRRILGTLAHLLPDAARFRLLGLPSGDLRGDPAGLIPGYRAEPGPVGTVHHLPGGIAWGRGAHLDAGYRLIHVLSPGINCGMDYWMLKRQRFFPRLNSLRQETVSLVADGHGNYYHWMLDVLPRLAAFERESLVHRHYLVNQDHPFHRQTLDLLDIPAGSRTATASPEFYSAPELLVPLVPLGVSPENVRFVRNLLLERTGLAQTPPANERIYISRRHANSRRVLNEEELAPLLKKHHFRVCYLEQLSLRQQMLLFHGAETILAPHGAAWTNLIFARSGALALEIVPEGLESTRSGAYHLYAGLAAVAGVGYERVMARTSRSDHPHAADLRLEPEALEKLFERHFSFQQ
jgi:capsular polysaccharide biosynthesis protein